jgi:hypothetical protein
MQQRFFGIKFEDLPKVCRLIGNIKIVSVGTTRALIEIDNYAQPFVPILIERNIIDEQS